MSDLDGREILDALAQAYGLLSDIVLDAHIKLGGTTCISSGGTYPHFRSTYHISGTLPCMIIGGECRSQSVKLQTGQKIEMVRVISPKPDPAIAIRRYDLLDRDKLSDWQAADPLLFAEKMLFIAKRMLRKDKTLVRVAFIRDGRGVWHQVVLRQPTEPKSIF